MDTGGSFCGSKRPERQSDHLTPLSHTTSRRGA